MPIDFQKVTKQASTLLVKDGNPAFVIVTDKDAGNRMQKKTSRKKKTQQEIAIMNRLKEILNESASELVSPDPGEDYKIYDFNPDPLASMPFLEFAGRLPGKDSLEIPESPLGIGFETLDRRTFEPLEILPLLVHTGVKHARCQTGWLRCEKERGKFDFAWLDEVVDGLAAIGIRTWFSLSYGNPLYTPDRKCEEAIAAAEKAGKPVPGWARGYVGLPPCYFGKEAMKGWLRYVKALAEHFRGRVSEWEVWNEPEACWRKNEDNVAAEEGIPAAARDYVNFVRVTAEAVRSVIPDAKMVADVAQTGTTYIRELGKNKLGEVIDVFSYHFYGSVPEDFLRNRIDHIRANLEIPGRKLEIWQGESGRASGKCSLFSMPTEYNQAKYLLRRHLSDFACGATLTSFFTAVDLLHYYTDCADSYFGIIHGRTRTPKLAYFAMRTLGWLFDGLKPAPEFFCGFEPLTFHQFRSSLPYNVKTLSMTRKGVPVFAFWLPENVDISAQTVPGILHITTEDVPLLKNPVFLDPIRGNVYAFRNEFAERNLNFSSFIGAQKFGPISIPDFPLLISDASLFEQE